MGNEKRYGKDVNYIPELKTKKPLKHPLTTIYDIEYFAGSLNERINDIHRQPKLPMYQEVKYYDCRFYDSKPHIILHERLNLAFKRCLFKNLNVLTCIFINCVFEDCVFENLKIKQCSFRNCIFNKCLFNNVTFTKGRIIDSILDLETCDVSNKLWILDETDLSGTEGIPSPIDFLKENFETCKEGIIAYKTIGEFYTCPKKWDISVGSVLEETVDTNRGCLCGCGVNVATLDWIHAYTYNQTILKLLIPWEWTPGIVVPYFSKGKIRCERAKIIGILSRREVIENESKTGDPDPK